MGHTMNPTIDRRLTLMLVAASLAASIAVACRSSSTAPKALGTLAVTITQPPGTTPSVTLTGPQGYAATLGLSAVLGGLASGSYTVVADSAVRADPVVGTIIDTASVAGSPVTVTAGDTGRVSVVYTNKSRVGGLWVGAYNHAAYDYSVNQLDRSGEPPVADSLYTASVSAMVIDARGNMWVAGWTTDTLRMFTRADRNGHTGPTVTLVSPGLTQPMCLTIDSQGNLWVVENLAAQLIAFTPSQLTAGGTQAPTITVSSPSIKQPTALAFDAHGNGWVSNASITVNYTETDLLQFSAAQMAASGSPVPVDTIVVGGGLGVPLGSALYPRGMVFDGAGNLWVAASGPTGAILEFTPAELAVSGTPSPHVAITPTAAMLPYYGPQFLTFDARGDLWVSDQYAHVFEYTTGQIATSGTVTPAITVAVNGPVSGFTQLAFDPGATAVGSVLERAHPANPALSRRNRLTSSLRSR